MVDCPLRDHRAADHTKLVHSTDLLCHPDGRVFFRAVFTAPVLSLAGADLPLESGQRDGGRVYRLVAGGCSFTRSGVDGGPVPAQASAARWNVAGRVGISAVVIGRLAAAILRLLRGAGRRGFGGFNPPQLYSDRSMV